MSRARIERSGDGRFLLSGVLNFDTVPEVWRQSVALFSEGSSLEIDLGGVERSDSAGLAILIEWMREARRRGQSIRFLNIPAQMLAIARVSSLDHILPLG